MVDTKSCLSCGGVFQRSTKLSRTQWEQSKFCSLPCSAQNQIKTLPAERRCYKCGETKLIGEFAADGSKYRHYQCKTCFTDRDRALELPRRHECGDLFRYHNDPTVKAEKKLAARRNSLKRNFGLTIEDYDNMLAAQAGVCAICGHPERSRSGCRLAVDHNHETGQVRGLLCSQCNRWLSVLENRDQYQAMLSYLEKYGDRP